MNRRGFLKGMVAATGLALALTPDVITPRNPVANPPWIPNESDYHADVMGIQRNGRTDAELREHLKKLIENQVMTGRIVA